MAQPSRRKGVLESETLDGEIGSEAPIPVRPSSSFEQLSPGEDGKPQLKTGDVLDGKYELLAPLSAGGMGNVWIAHNTMLDVKVALKVLRADDRDPQRKRRSTARLLVEARATARLVHPAIVRMIDFGETPSGNAFFVMELLEGEDLMQFLERHGKLSAVKAVRTLLPIAHALAAAHAKSIVHRDLKPQNVFLAREEDGTTIQPKLIDFGIAQVERVVDERITTAGTVMGSPGYMAPEQARGKDVDERVDVWGLCVVLYEAITGRLPFQGKNYNALMRSIIEDEAPPLTSFGVGDPTLSAIIARGLAKDPEQRWPTMRELGTRLAKWLIGREVYEDICGRPLAALWVRERSGADLAGPSWVPPSLESGAPARTTDAPVSGTRSALVAGEPSEADARATPTPTPGAPLASEDLDAPPATPLARPWRPVVIGALLVSVLSAAAWWFASASDAADQTASSARAAPSAAPVDSSAGHQPPPAASAQSPAVTAVASIPVVATETAGSALPSVSARANGAATVARPKGTAKAQLKTPKF